jgi:hypothetical protein
MAEREVMVLLTGAGMETPADLRSQQFSPN